MRFAQLGDTEEYTHVSALIGFVPSIPDGAVYVPRDLIDEHVFRSRHRCIFKRQIGPVLMERYQLTCDNDSLSDEEKEHLDDRGVIKKGVHVRIGDVLWSCLETPKAAKTRKVKKKTEPQDGSERVSQLWDGAIVSEVELEEGENGIEIAVTLELKLELRPGDLLRADDHGLGVVAKIIDSHEARTLHPEAEILASREAAKRMGKSGAVATMEVAKSDEVAHFDVLARKGGPYSLISRQPLNRGEYATAQTVTVSHSKWLLDRGFPNLVEEFASLKCDEVESRSSLEAYAKGDIDRSELPPPSAPVSRWLLQAQLMAMGLHVDIEGGDGLTIRVRPATRAELLAVSSGLVKKPETLNYRTHDGEPDGLFCPTVFNDELTRFGHLELDSPIVPIWWRRGSPSLLERLLPFTDKQIEKLVYCDDYVRIQDGEAFIGDDETIRSEPGNWLTGGEAIRALLTEFASTDSLPPGLSHGLDALTTDIVLVLPSPLRPIVLLDSGNYATSDLNDLYRRLINRNNRLSKLTELNAPAVIVTNGARMLQYSVDVLFANQLTPKPVVGPKNIPLKSLSDTCLHEVTTDVFKRAVWSAKARAVGDTDVPRHMVVVPRGVFDDLRLSPDAPVLLSMEEGGAFVALSPEPGEDLLFRIPKHAAETLNYPADGDAMLSLHAPLRAEAVVEARRLQREEFDVEGEKPADSWLESCGEITEALMELVAAAIEHKPTRLDTPKTVFFAGGAKGG